MRKLIQEIPRTFKVCLIVSAILAVIAPITAGFVRDWAFAGQCATVGGFSVAILCLYVVWVAAVTMREKSRMCSQDREIAEEAGCKVVRLIQIGSILRTFCLAIFLILCIVLFRIDGIAAIIGVSVTIVPMAVVPIFVKPEPDPQIPETSEVENNV